MWVIPRDRVTTPNNSLKLVEHYCLVCGKVVNIFEILQIIAKLSYTFVDNAETVETGQLPAGNCSRLRCKMFSLLSWLLVDRKKRKDYAFWRQLNEKPSIIPGCPGSSGHIKL